MQISITTGTISRAECGASRQPWSAQRQAASCVEPLLSSQHSNGIKDTHPDQVHDDSAESHQAGDEQAVVRQGADAVGGDDAHAAVDAGIRRAVEVVDADLEGVVIEGEDGWREADTQEGADNLD